MDAVTTTHSMPLMFRILAWMDARFPHNRTILFFLLYFVSAIVARFITDESAIQIKSSDLFGCLATWSFFLLLRIFDEHKDYEIDLINYPDRVLQRGLITLDHLKVLAVACIALQLSWVIFLDKGLGNAFYSWGLLFLFACLMTKEFFCGPWLEKHLTIYAFSHMLSMPLVIWWLANMACPGVVLDEVMLALMSLAFISGFCFEITRKTRGPEEERDSVDSYSKVFGTKGSALVVMILLISMVINQIIILLMLCEKTPYWGILVIIISLVFGLTQLIRFIISPSEKGRETNEASVALTGMVGYVTLIVITLAERGVQWIVI